VRETTSNLTTRISALEDELNRLGGTVDDILKKLEDWEAR